MTYSSEELARLREMATDPETPREVFDDVVERIKVLTSTK